VARLAQIARDVVLRYALVAICCASLSLLLPVHTGIQNRASCGSPLRVALHREATMTIEPARLFGDALGVRELVAASRSRPASVSHAHCWEPARRRMADAAALFLLFGILTVVCRLARQADRSESRVDADTRWPGPAHGLVLGGGLVTGQLLLIGLMNARSVKAGEEWHYVRSFSFVPIGVMTSLSSPASTAHQRSCATTHASPRRSLCTHGRTCPAKSCSSRHSSP